MNRVKKEVNVLRAKDNIKVDMPLKEAFNHCKNILEENEFNLKQEDAEKGILKASKSLSWDSFGENIFVEIEALEDQKSLVKITSKCKFPLQFFDWGKNNENVNTITEELQKL